MELGIILIMKFFAKMKNAIKGCFGVRVEPNSIK
jgi:hypothetical protein